METAWAGAVYNLMLFMLASHVRVDTKQNLFTRTYYMMEPSLYFFAFFLFHARSLTLKHLLRLFLIIYVFPKAEF